MPTPASIVAISVFSTLIALTQLLAVILYWRQMHSKVERCISVRGNHPYSIGCHHLTAVKTDGQEAVSPCGFSTLLGLSTQVGPRLPHYFYLF